MIKYIIIISALCQFSLASARDSARFDYHGNLIPPDEVHLFKGLEHEEDGFQQLALKHFKKSAMYGNEHAKFFSALLHMQNDEYIEAYAWLKTLDAERINRVSKVDKLLTYIQQNIPADAIKLGREKSLKLDKIYNPTAAAIHREIWVNSFQHTGSRIKGNKTTSTKIFVNARGEEGQIGGPMMISGTLVNQQTFDRSLHDFVYNYTYELPITDVKLQDIELIDEN